MGEGASKPCRAILRTFKTKMPQMDLDLYLLMRKIKRNKHRSRSQDEVSMGDTDLATVEVWTELRRGIQSIFCR